MKSDFIVVLAGPTGSGKSTLTMDIVEEIRKHAQMAIVCGDSRQLFQGMRIGSAGPSDDDEHRVWHLGYHRVPPESQYDAARFLDDTDRFTQFAWREKHIPLVVGGSGLYLRSFRYGLTDVPGRDDVIRASLDERVARGELAQLFHDLTVVDGETALRISPHDAVRVVRALEVFQLTGRPASAMRKAHNQPRARVDGLWFRLAISRDMLRERLRTRIETMFADGLVDEAVRLAARIGRRHRHVDVMGFREALAVGDGKMTIDDAKDEILKRHAHFAKRQEVWFKKEQWWSVYDAPHTASDEKSIVSAISRRIVERMHERSRTSLDSASSMRHAETEKIHMTTNHGLIVAIDGPAGAGKSTVAARVADECGLMLVDTGALYRIAALLAGRHHVDQDDGNGIAKLLDKAAIEFRFTDGTNLVYLNGEDVSQAIRAPAVSMAASKVSSLPPVRAALFDLQRRLGRHARGSVLEGRDIGTVIFPDAHLKIFLTASVDERARRRVDQLAGQGKRVSFDETRVDIEQRDAQDRGRAIAPLRQAEDAILLDSTNISENDVVEKIVELVHSLRSSTK